MLIGPRSPSFGGGIGAGPHQPNRVLFVDRCQYLAVGRERQQFDIILHVKRGPLLSSCDFPQANRAIGAGGRQDPTIRAGGYRHDLRGVATQSGSGRRMIRDFDIDKDDVAVAQASGQSLTIGDIAERLHAD